jgi:hypothetical protein
MPNPTIHDWVLLTKPDSGSELFFGSIEGHHSVSPGEGSCTSKVVSTDFKEKTASTKNTDYDLGKPKEIWVQWLASVGNELGLELAKVYDISTEDLDASFLEDIVGAVYIQNISRNLGLLGPSQDWTMYQINLDKLGEEFLCEHCGGCGNGMGFGGSLYGKCKECNGKGLKEPQ